ncbi:hypothetical protein PAXINDRAFT_166346 [Paxillus involutus ATCC 200175]|nr:hypothetical protein PAXINDRAFT_166346 [Paxillus involutus ATCC 200175]
MEYNPRYPQPFTLDQAIALDPAVAWDEIARLRNSLLHLKRTQEELQEYSRELAPSEEDPDVCQAMKENEITIASQDERIFIIKLALTHHGHSVGSGDTSEPHLSPGSSASLGDMERQRSSNSMGSGSNGLDDTLQVEARDTLVTNPERQVEEREDHGVYL